MFFTVLAAAKPAAKKSVHAASKITAGPTMNGKQVMKTPPLFRAPRRDLSQKGHSLPPPLPSSLS
jgi:hypothetical protein